MTGVEYGSRERETVIWEWETAIATKQRHRHPATRPDSATAGQVSADTLALRATPGGTLLPVRVIPRASRVTIDGIVDGALRVRLTAPPVDGAANAALLALLAERLGLPRSAITLAAGATARHKTIMLAGLTPAEVRVRLTRPA